MENLKSLLSKEFLGSFYKIDIQIHSIEDFRKAMTHSIENMTSYERWRRKMDDDDDDDDDDMKS